MNLRHSKFNEKSAKRYQRKLNHRLVSLICIGILCFALVWVPKLSVAGEVVFVPAIRLDSQYSDNISFKKNSSQADSDFSGSAIPSAKIQYNTERFQLSGRSEVDFKKYLNDTDYDRTNHAHRVETEYQVHSRWTFLGDYLFRRDKTVDSQFEETGRVFERKRVKRHRARGGLRFALTELSDIATVVTYARADYSGDDNTDYDRYTIELPYTKRFQNQVDTIRLTPAYSRYFSDENEEAVDYRLTFGWTHRISETLTFDMNVGGRYTDVETKDGESDSNFGGIGNIGLEKRGETFTGSIRYGRDLRSTSEGEIINVDRLFVSGDKRITERFGLKFRGKAWHSTRENNNEPNDRVVSFELSPAVYYDLTEDHYVQLAYSYRNQQELDEPGNPSTQRNRVTLSFVFRFPQKWD
jgi:hypothetical protein